MSVKAIRVEYETPPLRAIYERWYEDDGESDDDVRSYFQGEFPRSKIRKIERTWIDEEGANP